MIPETMTYMLNVGLSAARTAASIGYTVSDILRERPNLEASEKLERCKSVIDGFQVSGTPNPQASYEEVVSLTFLTTFVLDYFREELKNKKWNREEDSSSDEELEDLDNLIEMEMQFWHLKNKLNDVIASSKS
jgi:hypothetical protein